MIAIQLIFSFKTNFQINFTVNTYAIHYNVSYQMIFFDLMFLKVSKNTTVIIAPLLAVNETHLWISGLNLICVLIDRYY